MSTQLSVLAAAHLENPPPQARTHAHTHFLYFRLFHKRNLLQLTQRCILHPPVGPFHAQTATLPTAPASNASPHHAVVPLHQDMERRNNHEDGGKNSTLLSSSLCLAVRLGLKPTEVEEKLLSLLTEACAEPAPDPFGCTVCRVAPFWLAANERALVTSRFPSSILVWRFLLEMRARLLPGSRPGLGTSHLLPPSEGQEVTDEAGRAGLRLAFAGRQQKWKPPAMDQRERLHHQKKQKRADLLVCLSIFDQKYMKKTQEFSASS